MKSGVYQKKLINQYIITGEEIMQTFTGLQYIKIAIASYFGLDKMLWQERIQWVDEKLQDSDLYDLVPAATDPMLMLKAVNAYHDAMEGNPTGYIMGLDATASGLQIMACLMGCVETASNVNLVHPDKRVDAYQIGTDAMGMEGITRDMVKKPIMTTFYGSTEQPKSIFGEGLTLKAFYKMLWDKFPGAMECMEDMQGCWNSKAMEYTWHLPDGHTANMKVMVDKESKIEVDELNHATFTYCTQINAPKEKGLSLAANIVHSIDGWIVREMYRRCKKQNFDILTIHDSFWASPNHMNEVRQNYIDILAELADMNLLQYILNSITGNSDGKVKRYSSDLSQYIRKCEYALS